MSIDPSLINRRNKKAVVTENVPLQQILAYLSNRRDIVAYRTNNGGVYDPTRKCFRSPSKYSMPGLSDICGVTNTGRALYIEVKKPEVRDANGKRVQNPGYLSDAQKSFLSLMLAFNAIAFVAYGVEDVIRELDEALKP